MREVPILEFEGELISSLREYWSSEVIGPRRRPEQILELSPAGHGTRVHPIAGCSSKRCRLRDLTEPLDHLLVPLCPVRGNKPAQVL